ncbi:MAG: hypothetical protein AB9882_05260 [Ignavibacteriaceae bacterium]
MKKLKYAVILFLLILIQGCDAPEIPGFTGERLSDIFSSSLRGDSAALAFTKGVFDPKLPPPGKWNMIKVDSIMTEGGGKFFGVILEYSNPIYNRFCVYDSLFNLMLTDKSLNGYLTLRPVQDPNITGFEVTEMFDSKDSIKLKRGNLYTLRGSAFELSFRKFTEMRLGENYLSQTINVMTSKVISTKLLSSKNIQLRFYEDTFLYDTEQRRYLSGEDIVSSKIYEFIYNYRDDSSKNYIRDEISALKSTGMQVTDDAVNMSNNYKDVLANFSIFLPNGWLFKKNVLFTHNVKKTMITTHFFNGDRSANLYVGRMRKGETSADYLTMKLDKETKGNYAIKYIEKMIVEKMWCVYYEFTCKELVFMIVIEAEEDTYERYQGDFDRMVNSFLIDC